MSIFVRPATLGDYQALCALFEELDEFHRKARPDFFRSFDGPARSWEQVGRWLAGPASTVLVAEEGDELIGLSLLLPRPQPPFAGAVPRKVVVIDNLVVRADSRDRSRAESGAGRRLRADGIPAQSAGSDPGNFFDRGSRVGARCRCMA